MVIAFKAVDSSTDYYFLERCFIFLSIANAVEFQTAVLSNQHSHIQTVASSTSSRAAHPSPHLACLSAVFLTPLSP
jgi:hypothetical protein